MANRYKWALTSSIVLAIGLTGCGGGGGGSVNSTPVPPPPPPPPPPASPTGLLEPGSSIEFPTYGFSTRYSEDKATGDWTAMPVDADSPILFRYSQETQSYEIQVPGFEPGRLQKRLPQYDDLTYFDVTAGAATGTLQKLFAYFSRPGPGNPVVQLNYTSLAGWSGDLPGTSTHNNFSSGIFVYGIPTAAADVPRAGTATYDAMVRGSSSFGGIEGNARLAFDFGAGSLGGHMDPILRRPDDSRTPLARYDFIQTIFSVGSPTFSGRFAVAGPEGANYFEGRFTGPQAAELMGRWQAPILDPQSGNWGGMHGVWLGKKN